MLQENIKDAQKTAAQQYNKTAGITKYKQGQIVYICNENTKPGTSKKLQDRFLGPYSVSEVHEHDTYSLVHIYTGRSYPSREHTNRLRSAHLDRTDLLTKYARHLPLPTPTSDSTEDTLSTSAPSHPDVPTHAGDNAPAGNVNLDAD